MREILFRGKRVDDNEWMYGSLIIDCKLRDKSKEIPYIRERGMNEATSYYYGGAGLEVNPDTLGQFTSVYDKNGNKVFTGDIIDYNGEKIIVHFMCCHYSAYDLKGTYYQLPLITAGGGVVIGNIYDNPELLEGDDAKD